MTKKMQHISATAAKLFATVAVAVCLGGCKGRTMENMEPTGDTVEVDIRIQQPDTAAYALAEATPDADTAQPTHQ